MAIFGKCCCCDLKTGNIVLGALWLLSCVCGLGMSAYNINTANSLMRQLSYLNDQELENAYNAMLVTNAIYVVLCLLYIPASICLITGALKDNRKLVAVFLVVDGINIVLIFLKMLIVFFIFKFDIQILIQCILGAGIAIFIWLFPYSLYQTLQDSSSGGSWTGGQVHYPAQGGQVQYPAQTQSYVPVPLSVAYPSQGQAPQAPPAYQPYPQKY